ncbi:WD40 repeat-like protein [Mycena vitilis]|nr:WD40 repeat-like protein [Mycena vitilis]
MTSYLLLVHSCEGVTWARRKAPNLYVVIHQGGKDVQRTTVIKRDLAPNWDFLCNLSLDSPIVLRLWHGSLLRCRDVCLGVAHTDLASLLYLRSSDTEFIRLRLISEDRQSSGTPAGTVLVRLMGQREAVTTALANAQQDLAKLTPGSVLTEATDIIENPPLVTETFEAGLSLIIAKLDVIVHLGDEVAQIHPYANMAWKILTSVYKAIKREQATEEKLHKLVDTMVAVYSFAEETDVLAQKLKNLEDKVLAIVKQTVECALFIREYSGHGFTARAIRNTGKNIDNIIDSLAETLLKLRDSLESSVNIRGVFLSTQILEKVDHLVQSDAFKTLNAADMNAASRPTCLQGTRVQLLDEISDGLMAPEATSSVLWLSGVAGSGKSTITTTISVFFRGLHRLGGFLFFDRNNPSRSHPDRVIRTLAHFLARQNSHIASAIAAALELDPDTINAPLQTQFETLLLKPLLAVEHLMQGPVLIILDALDECGDQASRRALLSVISTEFRKLPSYFRVLITSRREADISNTFASCFVEKTVGTATSMEDVQHFISHELERIQEHNKLGTAWPEETQKQTMMKLAGGLFIWAATAIKFIDGYRPNDRIETLITSNSTSLDSLYSFTLSKSAPWDDRNFAKDARAVLACIVFGKLPMTETTIDALLCGSCSSSEVLKYLGCVVQWQTGCVAQILHASFADYLMDPSRNKGEPWAIDMKTAHQKLSLGCLQILNTQLRFNICGLEDSHILNVDVPDISIRVATNISAPLLYSSCFWGDHIAGSPFDPRILEDISHFFHSNFLFWMEVLSLINQMSVTLLTLDSVAHYIKGPDNELGGLIIDAAKFVSAFSPLIAHSVPHLYLSAVPFTPPESWTARQFDGWFPNRLGFDSQLGLKWPAIQKVLHGHNNCVTSVTFSPNGRQIASASFDETVRIWDTQTGVLVAGPFTGHTSWVWSVNFSPDGSRIASGSHDQTVRIWDAQTGVLVTAPFTGHTNSVTSVHFSPNGKQVASGSVDKTVRIWDAQTGALLAGPFTDHTDRVLSVCFSPDGRQIASGSGDDTVRIWDAQIGVLVAGPYTGHTERVNSVNFSSDGSQIASGSSDQTVCVWDVQTGALLAGPLIGHIGDVLSVNFSPDGQYIASGSCDCTVRIWDAQTGVVVAAPFTGHTDWVLSVHFSPDSSRIASGSDDYTVRIWDVQTGVLIAGPLIGHTGPVESVRFSPDGRQIASGSGDRTVRIWDAQTGVLVAGPFPGFDPWARSVDSSPDGSQLVTSSDDRTIRICKVEELTGHTGSVQSVRFSPDGRQIASGSGDFTVRIWDAQTGVLVAGPFPGYDSWGRSVDSSPDGSQLGTSSYDHTIRICKVEQFPQTDTPAQFAAKEDLLSFDFDSGWVKNAAGSLMFWVPPWLREGLYLPHNTLVICAKGTTKLDLSRFVHGTEWTKCFDQKRLGTK